MEIDYAQLFKIYGNAPAEQSEVRYSLPFAWVLVSPAFRDSPISLTFQQASSNGRTSQCEWGPIYPPYERFLKEGAEPRSRDCASLHVLQLCADSPDFARDASDGSDYC